MTYGTAKLFPSFRIIHFQTVDNSPQVVSIWKFLDVNGDPDYTHSALMDVRIVARRIDDGLGTMMAWQTFGKDGSYPYGPVMALTGTNATPVQSSVSTDPVVPQLPVTVVTGVNDSFTWSNGPTAEVYTVAAGTYTTLADVIAAFLASLNGSSEPFSDDVAMVDNGSGGILVTSIQEIGGAGNEDQFYDAATNDIMVDVFGVSPATYNLTGGTGGTNYRFTSVEGGSLLPVQSDGMPWTAFIHTGIGGIFDTNEIFLQLTGHPGGTVDWVITVEVDEVVG